MNGLLTGHHGLLAAGTIMITAGRPRREDPDQQGAHPCRLYCVKFTDFVEYGAAFQWLQ